MTLGAKGPDMANSQARSRGIAVPAAVPRYDVDLYGDDVIAEPYGHYRAIRDLGPVVYLPKNDLWAVGRYDDVRTVLRDHAIFSSAKGIAANATVNDTSTGNTITSDPPDHTVMRGVIRAPLTVPALKHVEARITAEAEALVERLVAQRSFDVVADLARHLPVSIVSDLVGLPEEGRANMLRWAAATFDVLGVMNARGLAARGDVLELHAYCQDPATLRNLRSDGWAAAIWQAADRGEISRDKCPVMMRDYISPSLDTTIFATASLIWLLGINPDQWTRVRSNPALITPAINEAIRLESPIRAFTRVAVRHCEIVGAQIPAGARLLVLYASANRDERRWKDPERFDVEREAQTHLGFGFGAHICAGMHLARLEMTALLKALAARVERFELGTPVWAQNNVLRGLASLPVRVH